MLSDDIEGRSNRVDERPEEKNNHHTLAGSHCTRPVIPNGGRAGGPQIAGYYKEKGDSETCELVGDRRRVKARDIDFRVLGCVNLDHRKHCQHTHCIDALDSARLSSHVCSDEKLKDMHDIAVLANYLAHVKVGRSLSRNCWTFRRRNS